MLGDKRPSHLTSNADWENTSCPGCGNNSYSYWRVVVDDYNPSLKVTLVRCSYCDLIFTNPRPREEVMGSYYPADYICNHFWLSPPEKKMSLRDRFFEFFFVKDRERRKVHQLKKALGSLSHDNRILDVGCGTGLFLKTVHEKYGCSVVGVEPSGNAVERIKDNLSLTIYRTLPDEGTIEPFDAITLWYVFEHMHDPRTLLHKCRRLLKPGGIMLIEVPNVTGWPAILCGRYWAGYDAPRHTVHFTPKTLKLVIEAAGWQVTKIIYPTQAVGTAFALGRLLDRRWLNNPRKHCWELGMVFAVLTPIAFILSQLRVNDAILIKAS